MVRISERRGYPQISCMVTAISLLKLPQLDGDFSGAQRTYLLDGLQLESVNSGGYVMCAAGYRTVLLCLLEPNS